MHNGFGGGPAATTLQLHSTTNGLGSIEQLRETPDESIHCIHFDHRINAIGFKSVQDMNITVAVGSMVMDRYNNKVEIYRLTEATTISNEQP